MIRTLWFWLLGVVLTLWHGIPIVIRRPGAKRLPALCDRNPRVWSRRLLRAAGVEVELEGVHHLSRERSAVLVANHQSWFDIWVLVAHLPVDYRFVAKKELEGIPVFGAAWKACGHISIDRADRPRAIAALQRAAGAMRAGCPTVIMFPEGTRSPDGALLPFKKGAFVLAIESGVPVVPAAILGTREVMPKGAWRVRPGRVKVRIGPPLAVAGMTTNDRDRLRLAAHRAVGDLLNEVSA